MGYDPKKHHRRSIRLRGYDYASAGGYFITICTHQRQCLFGDIVAGDMRLNTLGETVQSHWMRLPRHHPHVRLDAFVVMPNHVHGILILTENPPPPPPAGAGLTDHPAGAGLADNPLAPNQTPSTKPVSTNPSGKTVFPHSSEDNARFGRADFGAHGPEDPPARSPTPAPIGRLVHSKQHGIPEILRGFKTFSARRINQIRKIRGIPVWQRNYYERIIRDEIALRNIRRYIRNNPMSWQQDQLRRDR